MIHAPVLVKEILQYLNPQPNENFIDCTVGEGGHTLEILQKTAPFGKLLGIDADKHQIDKARENTREFSQRVILINDSYAHLKEIVEKARFAPIDGIFLDLGYSSFHIEESGRGFSFLKDEPLDMRYDARNELTAEIIVNRYPEQEIEKILRQFGEEKFAKHIARNIAKERDQKKITTTFQLVEIIKKSIPGRAQSGKIHIATRTFQALRIAVNGELDNLKAFLPQALAVLKNGGRLAVISFHSLEDRIVKNFFKNNSEAQILTDKPVTASQEEIISNPRARSAKLRAVMKY